MPIIPGIKNLNMFFFWGDVQYLPSFSEFEGYDHPYSNLKGTTVVRQGLDYKEAYAFVSGSCVFEDSKNYEKNSVNGTVEIYDIAGRKIKRIPFSGLDINREILNIHQEEISKSGIFYLNSNSFKLKKKVVFLKWR